MSTRCIIIGGLLALAGCDAEVSSSRDQATRKSSTQAESVVRSPLETNEPKIEPSATLNASSSPAPLSEAFSSPVAEPMPSSSSTPLSPTQKTLLLREVPSFNRPASVEAVLDGTFSVAMTESSQGLYLALDKCKFIRVTKDNAQDSTFGIHGVAACKALETATAKALEKFVRCGPQITLFEASEARILVGGHTACVDSPGFFLETYDVNGSFLKSLSRDDVKDLALSNTPETVWISFPHKYQDQVIDGTLHRWPVGYSIYGLRKADLERDLRFPEGKELVINHGLTGLVRRFPDGLSTAYYPRLTVKSFAGETYFGVHGYREGQPITILQRLEASSELGHAVELKGVSTDVWTFHQGAFYFYGIDAAISDTVVQSRHVVTKYDRQGHIDRSFGVEGTATLPEPYQHAVSFELVVFQDRLVGLGRTWSDNTSYRTVAFHVDGGKNLQDALASPIEEFTYHGCSHVRSSELLLCGMGKNQSDQRIKHFPSVVNLIDAQIPF